MNSRTLRSIYSSVNVEGFEQKVEDGVILNGTQLTSLHLCLHRPDAFGETLDANFGPYISTLPKQFDNHPLTWLVKREQNLATEPEILLLSCCPPGVMLDLENVAARFRHDWESVLQCKVSRSHFYFLEDINLLPHRKTIPRYFGIKDKMRTSH